MMTRQRTLVTDDRIQNFLEALAKRGRDIPAIRNLCLGERNFLKSTKYIKRGDDQLVTLSLRTRHKLIARYRNAIRERFGEKHPSLEYMRLSDTEQEQRNAADQQKVLGRHADRRALNAEEHVTRAWEILGEHPAHSPLKVAAALIAVTGRRPVEIFLTGDLKIVPDKSIDAALFDAKVKGRWVMKFSGQAKTRGADNDTPYQIPVLLAPAVILEAFKGLRSRYSCEGLTPEQVGNRTSKELGKYAKALFADTAGDEMNPSQLRAAYATIAYEWFAPMQYSWNIYTAQILGHKVGDLSTSFSYDQFYPVGSKRDYDRDIHRATKETLESLIAQRAKEKDERAQAYLDARITAVKKRLEA